jgi:hypothetical protein
MENAPQTANPNLTFVLYYIFKVMPMFVGGLAVYLGYKLFILGVTGQASLNVESKAVSAQLLNAAPGLFFAVGGLTAVIVSIFKGVEIRYAKPTSKNPRQGLLVQRRGWCETPNQAMQRTADRPYA